MISRYLCAVCAALTLLLGLSGTAAARNVALVIANSEYQHTSQLANPASDARLADGADAALVYFAGHGIESAGRNWLLPVDAPLEEEKDLPFDAVELQLVLGTLDGAKLRIAVLDACRNNPFANRWQSDNRSISRGLAPLEVDNMLVIYAAAPGAFAFDGADGNSPFALALARRIVQPGLPVQMLGGMVRDDVLIATDGDQRPFISASMTGRPLFLVEGPDTQMAWLTSLYGDGASQDEPCPQCAGTSTSHSPATVDFEQVVDSLEASRDVARTNPEWLDEQVWLEALKADKVQSYRAYLEQFPDGIYARFAEANIAQLLDPTATGGEIDSEKPWIISLGAALPGRYAVDLGVPLPIDGVWRISTNNKRLRIERGRAFAVDGWNHALLFRVQPDQVTTINLRRAEPGRYLGRDILLNGETELVLRADGNLDVSVATFRFPIEFVLIREALDDPAAILDEMPQ